MKTAKKKILQKQILLNGIGVLIFFFTIYALFQKDNFCVPFLGILFFQIVMTFFKARKIHWVCVHSARILLGLVFVFSGFVKGVDPLGTQYKIEDYFIAFGTDWAIPYALLLSYIMNLLEFSVGIFLIFNIRFKLTLRLLGAMMLFFTLTTLNDAINNPVPDCGCFGDAVKLSNWQTFYKNLVLDFLWLTLWFNQNRIKAYFSSGYQNLILLLVISAFLSMELYSVRHLPPVDFRDWKIGKNMIAKERLPVQYFLSYRNKQSGEVKEYLSPDYPYDDSVWVANWEYVDKRIVDPNVPLHEVMITDEAGEDITDLIINDTDTSLFIAMPSLDASSQKQFLQLSEDLAALRDKQVHLILLSADANEKLEELLKLADLTDIEYYYADDIALKAMVRSNPGFVLLQQGIVKGKWNARDFSTGKLLMKM
jgi:uncharacterized membrane protein YphA (DoxX/SURF4 family)